MTSVEALLGFVRNSGSAYKRSNQLTGSVQTCVGARDRLYHRVAVFHVNHEIRCCLPQRRYRKLHLLIDVTLEKARAILRVETFLGQEVERFIRDADLFALALHLALQFLQVKLGDLAHLIHRQWREDNNLVNAIAKLRRETLLRSLHYFILYHTKVLRGFGAKAERFLKLLEAV